jgi:hypothetical protein
LKIDGKEVFGKIVQDNRMKRHSLAELPRSERIITNKYASLA